MEKKTFHESIDQIVVPADDVVKAIQAGVKRGEQMKVKRSFRFKKAAVFTAAAAVLVLASGFLFPSISNVMADIPFFAKLYENAKLDKKTEGGIVTEKRRITIPLVPESEYIEVRLSEKLKSVKIAL